MTLPTIPVVCIVVAYLLVYLPHFVAGPARFKMAGGFDNHHPRDQTARLEGWARRAAAAHQNGHESFAPFAIAVLVALAGHGAEPTVSKLAVAYVVLRAAYIGLYLADVAAARSFVWTAGFAITITLFLLPLFS